MSALMKQVLDGSPLAYWPMDESSGTTLVDRTGNGRNLTLTGGYTLSQSMGAGLRGVDFNGTTGYASRASESWMNLANAYTLIAFGVVDAAPSGTEFLAGMVGRDRQTGDTNGGPAWRLSVWTNDGSATDKQVYANKTSAPNSPIDIFNGTPYVVGSLHQFVARWTGTELAAGLDGVMGPATSTNTAPSTTARGVLVGRLALANTDRFFNGKIAHAAIFGSSLSDDQIRSIFKAGIRGGVVVG